MVLAFIVLALAANACSGGSHDRSGNSGIPGADVARGRAIFAQQCAACHGAGGTGGPIASSLLRERTRKSYRQVRAAVLDPPPVMPKLYPSRLTRNDVRDVSAYVESL